MESFFSLLQKNRRRWQIRTELRLAIVAWIETTDHRRRRQEVPDVGAAAPDTATS
jgi:putative transposase